MAAVRSLHLIMAAAVTALAMCAGMALASSADTEKPSQELVFGVLTPQCFEAFFTHHDFANVACLKFVVSKTLGYLIIVGSLILKLPQILKILGAKDVTGLTPASFYMEVLLYASSTIYNVRRGYPVSTWGENVVILVQNVILVLLVWTFYTPKIGMGSRLGLTVFFGLLVAGMFLLPTEHLWMLASAGIPVTIVARIPQVITNFKNGHTGQLALVTLTMNFAGSLARLFTTLQVRRPLWRKPRWWLMILMMTLCDRKRAIRCRSGALAWQFCSTRRWCCRCSSSGARPTRRWPRPPRRRRSKWLVSGYPGQSRQNISQWLLLRKQHGSFPLALHLLCVSSCCCDAPTVW